MAINDNFDVAIVGCGPVGGALATLLGQRGHRVVVIERWPSPYPLPRAVHFDHEVARILQACGLGADLPRITEPATDYEWRNAAGQVLVQFGGRELGPSGWPDSNMFSQPELEALIEARARAQPTVEVRRGFELTAIADTVDGVELTTRPCEAHASSDATDARGDVAAGGDGHAIRARYLVGCDGANSTVRGLVGATVTDLGFFYDWLIVDVALHEPRIFDPMNVQICDPARPTTLVSGGPGRRRWEFMRLPNETVDELNDEARAWQLLADWDITPDNATLERHALYTFQARWVDQWRVGHVLLAGDAAHQMPPFAGQGLCSGLRDAANLAWKLDLVLTGRAPDRLLEAYGRERAVNVRAVIEFSMELGKIICVPDPAEAAARDEAMITGAMQAGPQPVPPLPGIVDGVRFGGDPLAGELFIQGRVSDGDRSARFDDVVGGGWRLVTMDTDIAASLPAETVAWFADIGGRVVALGDGGLSDVDGVYDWWFETHGVRVALQRPDFYLFGTATDASGATRLIDGLRDALTRPDDVLTGAAEGGGA